MRSMLLEPMPCIALVAAIVLIAAVACGDNGEDATDPEGATAAPTSASGTPALPLDTPTPPASETVPGEIETAARKFLAEELEVDEGGLELDSSEMVQWSDASLGCPQEGMAYAQVVTPGHKLVYDLAGTSHAVHTNSDGSHMVVCEDEQ